MFSNPVLRLDLMRVNFRFEERMLALKPLKTFRQLILALVDAFNCSAKAPARDPHDAQPFMIGTVGKC